MPGGSWTEMVYDKLNRVVATQDGELKAASQWLVTKYDKLGRPSVTGFISTSNDRTSLQGQVDGNSILYETLSGASYSNKLAPVITTVLSTTFYDNYDFLSSITGGTDYTFDASLALPTLEPLATNASANQGRVTGVQIAILNPEAGMPGDLLTVTYYDKFGREIQTFADNHLGGIEIMSNRYNFVGELIENVLLHNTNQSPDVTKRIYKLYTYDHRGRLLRLTQQIDEDDPVIIAEHHYDELGQLIEKNLHATECDSFLQSVDYTYNIRGWMTGINQLSADGATVGSTPMGKGSGDSWSDLFALSLKYNEGIDGLNGTALYNGNISSMLWQSPEETNSLGYVFAYDKLNRLSEAQYGEVLQGSGPSYTIPSNALKDRFKLENLSYDRNGNILSLDRYGMTGASTYGLMDDLSYSYRTNSNTLLSVADAGSNTIIAGVDQFIRVGTSDFQYDQNGNLANDPNKGFDYTYNHLNKPFSAIKGADTLEWVYSADGTKLKQKIVESSSTTYHDYVGSFFYIDDVLAHFQHEEGRILVNGSTHQYEYNLTDHLGNIRLSFADVNDDGKIDVNATGVNAEVLQIDHYYPFGMRMGGLSYNSGTENRYRYNSKEYHQELGLGLYDYGFRWYDPVIARFVSVDPLAEKFTHNAVYAYAENRPIDGIDLEGLEWENFKSKFKKTSQLKLKPVPSGEGVQNQVYSVVVKSPSRTIDDLKSTFEDRPQDVLSNSKATFQPVDKDGNKLEKANLTVGSDIDIAIFGPLNNSSVRVTDKESNESGFSFTFQTLEGHVEAGEITFSANKDEEGSIKFSINSVSKVDQFAASMMEDFARSEQSKSWQEVLTNVVNFLGGKESNRVVKAEDQTPKENK